MLGELFAKEHSVCGGLFEVTSLAKAVVAVIGGVSPAIVCIISGGNWLDVWALNTRPTALSHYLGVGRPDISNDFGSPFGLRKQS